ncbi:nuclease domain-containing protein [Photobacterium andalusiense]|uniref:DUF1364 domain-containing protein n=1 Tax=Photobacterium andalusiense TaxID=2204296 RepID=A0A1Y6MCD4_9GAMM|nr:nuclease domain-containing protein [Photobacterium andalusiense]SMY34257.1 hypothetical protein PAND9192_01239 [Photobacterium andalusiense]
MISKTTALRSDKLRNAAKNQQCSVQILGVCNFNPDTVVLAHLFSTAHGMAYKSDDFWAVDCCSNCHDVLDGRVSFEWLAGEKEQYMLAALHITLMRRIRDGILIIQ